MDRDPLADRVAALERAVTDGHVDDGLQDAAQTAARLDEVASTVEALHDRVAELEATVQALRGFAGGVRAVDEAVERRANDAAARVDRLETDLRAVEDALEDAERRRERADAADHADDRLDRSDAVADTDRGTPANGTERFGDDGAQTESPDDRQSLGQTSAGGRSDATTAMDGSENATTVTAGPETLPERVRAESDAALASAAANAEREPTPDDTSTPSLGERLRRLL